MSLQQSILAVAVTFVLSVTATATLAQTKPAVKDLGGAAPASVIFIGNSFFYYNNSMHGHVSRIVAEGMKGHVSQHLGDDQRLRPRLA